MEVKKIKTEYKYFTVEHPFADRYNLMEKKESRDENNNTFHQFLGSIEKHNGKFVFIPEQLDDIELIWYPDCLQDVLSVFKEI